MLKSTEVVGAGSTRIVDESQLKLYARASVRSFETGPSPQPTRVVSEAEMRRSARMSVVDPDTVDTFEDESSTVIDAPEHEDDGTTDMPSTGVVAKPIVPASWNRESTTDVARTAPRAKSPSSPRRERGDPRELLTVPTPLAASRRSKQRLIIAPVCVDHDLAPTHQAARAYKGPAPSFESAPSFVSAAPFESAHAFEPEPVHESAPAYETPSARDRRWARPAYVGPAYVEPIYEGDDEDDDDVAPPLKPARVDPAFKPARIEFAVKPARVEPAVKPVHDEPVILLRAKATRPPPVAVPEPMTAAPSRPVMSHPRSSRWTTRHLLVGLVLVLSLGGIAMGATFLAAYDFEDSPPPVEPTPTKPARAQQATPAKPAPMSARTPNVSDERTMPAVRMEAIAPPSTSSIGMLRVKLEPADAHVRIDRVARKRSATIELELGRHEVEVARRGYRPWRGTIEVTAAETVLWVALRRNLPRPVVATPTPSEEDPVAPSRKAPPSKTTVTPMPEPTIEPISDDASSGPSTQSDDTENPLATM